MTTVDHWRRECARSQARSEMRRTHTGPPAPDRRPLVAAAVAVLVVLAVAAAVLILSL
jgi:hypothetical protein